MILSTKSDKTTFEVIRWLEYLNIQYEVLFETLPPKFPVTLSKGVYKIGNTDANKSFWYRRGKDFWKANQEKYRKKKEFLKLKIQN